MFRVIDDDTLDILSRGSRAFHHGQISRQLSVLLDGLRDGIPDSEVSGPDSTREVTFLCNFPIDVHCLLSDALLVRACPLVYLRNQVAITSMIFLYNIT